MLEIIILVTLCKNIGRIVGDKGRSKVPFVLLTIVFWFGGEIGGAIFGATFEMVVMNKKEPSYVAYICGLVGAGLGALIAFVIAKSVSPAVVFEDPGDEYDRRWDDGRGDAMPEPRRNPGSTGIYPDANPGEERYKE
jgi:hypothetical protein